MQPFAEGFLKILETIHAEIEAAIQNLPAEALDWSPGPDANSIAVLLAHVAGSERFWIGDVAAQDPSNRDRQAEFRTRGVEIEALKTRLAASLDYSRGYFARLQAEDLDAIRTHPDGRQFTVAWCIGHVLEHNATHLGHIHITRQVWVQQHNG